MRSLILTATLLSAGAVYGQVPDRPTLGYSLAELRFVDVDVNGGDGFRLGGSYRLEGNWLIVGALTDLGFNNNVDSFTFEVGGGYVWPYRADWDLVATLRYVNTEVDTPVGSADDSGIGISGGVRGLIAPQFEIRGSVNHVTVGDSDTYIELAGDYYFTQEFAAGLSLDIGGDVDTITIGARWYFR